MPTRHGWAAAVAAVATVVAGRLFGVLELYVVGAALLAAAIVAVLVVNRPLPTLRVRRLARPATVAAGEPARVDLQLLNDGRTRTPRLRVWEPVGERGGAPMQMAPLPPGEVAAAAYRVPTARRGIVTTGPMRVEWTDPLGLARRTTRLPGRGEVLVVPERVPMMFPGLGSNGPLGTHLRMKAMGRSGSEFHSQREYVPGDDLRRINWKSTARTGTLIVREPAMETVHRCTVLLDTDARQYDGEGFERAVSAAASIISAATAHGVATRLVAPGLDLRGPDVAHEALRWLATVQLDDRDEQPPLATRAHLEGLGLLAVVTGRVGSTAERVAVEACGPDETLVSVVTMEVAPSRRFVVAATSLLELEQAWQRLVEGSAAS